MAILLKTVIISAAIIAVHLHPLVLVDAQIVINRWDDNCVMDEKLVNEIESYKTVTKRIMDEVRTTYGPTMYQEFTRFIDKFGARPSGRQVLEKSIDHMINLTKHYGINDVTTEELRVPHWTRVFETARMLEPQLKNIAILGLGSSISTPAVGITAEAIVISSFEELNETSISLIEGKIVVFDAHFVTYGDTVIYRTQGASRAARKGALATLVRSIAPFSLYTPHTGAQSYDNDVIKIPTAAITIEDADLLRRLQDAGEKIVLKMTLSYKSDTKKSRNTLIDLKGGSYPAKQVIVSGHIDSWDVGQGAMDDGGGMMISWFVPIVLNKLKLKPKRTIRAILWTAEEPGLIGAQAYLKKHKDELDNITFIMESDEGTFKPLGLDMAGSQAARCIVKSVLNQFAPINKITYSEYPGSDMTVFVKQGIPGASLLNENDRYFWYHHSEADTMNIMNMTDVVECAAFWAAFSYVIADLSVDIPRT